MYACIAVMQVSAHALNLLETQSHLSKEDQDRLPLCISLSKRAHALAHHTASDTSSNTRVILVLSLRDKRCEAQDPHLFAVIFNG